MARKKEVIKKEWEKIYDAMIARARELKKNKDPRKVDKLSGDLTEMWVKWQKLLGEALDKIAEKDWKDDKKLDAKRKEFKKWVNEQDAKYAKLNKELAEIEKDQQDLKEQAEVIEENSKSVEKWVEALNTKLTKVFAARDKADYDAGELALEIDKISDARRKVDNNVPVLPDAEEARAKLKIRIGTIEKIVQLDLKGQLQEAKEDAKIDAITTEAMWKDLKLLASYGAFSKLMYVHDIVKKTNWGKAGTKALYLQYKGEIEGITTLSQTVTQKFEELAAANDADWGDAPWGLVVVALKQEVLNYKAQFDKWKEMLKEKN